MYYTLLPTKKSGMSSKHHRNGLKANFKINVTLKTLRITSFDKITRSLNAIKLTTGRTSLLEVQLRVATNDDVHKPGLEIRSLYWAFR